MKNVQHDLLTVFHTPYIGFEKRIVGRVRSAFAKAKHADTFNADNQEADCRQSGFWQGWSEQ